MTKLYTVDMTVVTRVSVMAENESMARAGALEAVKEMEDDYTTSSFETPNGSQVVVTAMTGTVTDSTFEEDIDMEGDDDTA